MNLSRLPTDNSKFYLFEISGQRLDAERIRRIIPIFLFEGKVDLSFSDYRYFFFFKKKAKIKNFF